MAQHQLKSRQSKSRNSPGKSVSDKPQLAGEKRFPAPTSPDLPAGLELSPAHFAPPNRNRLQVAQQRSLANRLGQVIGNGYLQKSVPQNPLLILQRTMEVPAIPAHSVRAAEANLTTNPQAAVNTVVQALVAQGQIDLSFLANRQVTYVSDRSRMPAGHYGHTSLTAGSGMPRPCRVIVGPDAARNVGLLYTTIMHEYQHVLQFRQGRPGNREAADEIEARLWEVEHLDQSGLWRDTQYMAVLPGQLNHWWNQLSSTGQAPYRTRYRAALATIQTMNRRRLDEQFRMQTGQAPGVARLLQRQETGAGSRTRTAVPTAAPATARPTFTTGRFISIAPRFNLEYTPVGPVPQEGNVVIRLKVHITYRNFSRAMMRRYRRYRRHRFTREQLRDFTWSEAEKRTFASGFRTSVQSAWSEKFAFHLNDPGFSEYRAKARVQVDVVPDKNQAHTRITAQKIPRGAPRFRSFVAGEEAVLELRDVSEPETREETGYQYVRQVGPFGFDQDLLSSSLQSQTRTIANDLRHLQSPAETHELLSDRYPIKFIGRASARGNRRYNQQLGLRRANAVASDIASSLGRTSIPLRVSSRGEEHASRDERFQRVDVVVLDMRRAFPETPITMTQNTAAHEAGHMFGLGDEYVEETPPHDVEAKFLGDRPSHYGDVEALMGTEAANDLLVQDSNSIMSEGGQVRRGHYVYFLQTLNRITDKHWTVE